MRASLLEQFSHPEAPRAERFFGDVAMLSATARVEKAVAALDPADPRSGAIATAARRWQASQPIRANRRAALGKLSRYAGEDARSGDAERFARLFIDSAADVGPVAFTFDTNGGPLLFGHHLIAVSGRTRITIADGTTEIASASGQLAIDADGPVGTSALHSLPILHDIRFVEVDTTAERVCGDDPQWLPIAFGELRADGRSRVFAEAFSLLETLSSDFLAWTTRLLDMVVVIPGLVDRTCSGSWADAPGTIYCSTPATPLEAAEILVHECAHQHFHLVETIGEVLRPGETRRFWSPPVQKTRPLDRILIAYHAFASVLTLYETAFEAGMGGDPRTWNRYRAFADDVIILQGYLDDADGLSDLGRAIYAPLRALRQSRQLVPEVALA